MELKKRRGLPLHPPRPLKACTNRGGKEAITAAEEVDLIKKRIVSSSISLTEVKSSKDARREALRELSDQWLDIGAIIACQLKRELERRMEGSFIDLNAMLSSFTKNSTILTELSQKINQLSS